MRRIPKTTYQSIEALEARIVARERDAMTTPAGVARQSILKEIAQLRVYVEAKRWTEPPSARPESQQATLNDRPCVDLPDDSAAKRLAKAISKATGNSVTVYSEGGTTVVKSKARRERELH